MAPAGSEAGEGAKKGAEPPLTPTRACRDREGATEQSTQPSLPHAPHRGQAKLESLWAARGLRDSCWQAPPPIDYWERDPLMGSGSLWSQAARPPGKPQTWSRPPAHTAPPAQICTANELGFDPRDHSPPLPI